VLTKFFVNVKKRENRDYIVIMDMSGSMHGRKWEQAKRATMQIAPFACQADPDGITLYLFNGISFPSHSQHSPRSPHPSHSPHFPHSPHSPRSPR
jgi:hypothetical protein